MCEALLPFTTTPARWSAFRYDHRAVVDDDIAVRGPAAAVSEAETGLGSLGMSILLVNPSP